MTGRYLEDYTEGEVIVTGSYTLSREELLTFARQYDAQEMHVDETHAAEQGPYGDVIASGFQTLAIAFKLYVDTGLFNGGIGVGGPGMDDLKWLLPVHAGDTLTNHVTIVEARRLSSKPERGVLRLGHDLRNQHGNSVLTAVTASFIKCRDMPA